MIPFKVKGRVKGSGAGRSTGQDRAGHLVLTAGHGYGVTAKHRPIETGVLEDLDVAAVEPSPLLTVPTLRLLAHRVSLPALLFPVPWCARLPWPRLPAHPVSQHKFTSSGVRTAISGNLFTTLSSSYFSSVPLGIDAP